MEKCKICGCVNFYKECGYFFCVTCQTQNEDIREEILEVHMDDTTKLRKTRIRRMKDSKTDKEFGWTSWELYNFVLIGLTNELIELGAPADIKITVLQLWARYLGKLEVAFTSTKKKLIPKLARRYKKRDAEIIYGKIFSQNKTRKRKETDNSIASSRASTYQNQESTLRKLNRNKKLMITTDYDRFIQSQASSEGDALSGFNQSGYSMHSSIEQLSEDYKTIYFNFSAKEETRKIKGMMKKAPRNKRNKYKKGYITNKYKMGPELITPMKLWAILYLALRIHNNAMQLGDMLRYGREGHLSYYKLDHLIPPEVTLTRNDLNFLSRVMDVTHKGMRRIIGNMATFLGVTKIICPNFLSLISRYCIELELPKGILLYGERLVALSRPKMNFDKKSCIPNYEGRAMAFIIIVMKILFAMDGITEYEISNFADKVNSINDLKNYIEVHDFMEEKIRDEQKEDFIDYLHRKIPCQFKIDAKKKYYYNDTRTTNINVKASPLTLTEFIFNETSSDGKLSIPDDNDNEDFQDDCINIFSEETKSSLSKFCEAYNINFSNTERTTISENLCLGKKRKRKLLRDTNGKFVKQNDIPLKHSIENLTENYCVKQTETIPGDNLEVKDILLEIPDICNSSDTSMFSDHTKIEVEHDQSENCSEAFKIAMDKSFYTIDNETDKTLRLFKPFKDYWMYHCNFSRVKSKNFELFEKTLPRSFRWLLNECASVIEMSPEDLYEEVCLIETYYTNLSEQMEVHTNTNFENRNQAYFNRILKRW
ncbi:hypothetical protein EAI_04977 [Harpegnathos saltator]|uniref:Rrn7/TAF1B C-terminal cyclin domain-containing protein n=1 Tax=Harpegnathos saltator TaxID=610380 RepID=E2BB55_HARSA|nr:hypothetical protein EAI_04977 [Harpegnathos saltator]